MMTNKRLEEIERSLAATTPGEWGTYGGSFGVPWVASDDTVEANMVCNPPDSYCEESIAAYWGANRAFIIAAHNSYIPELLAEVKRLQEEMRYEINLARQAAHHDGFIGGRNSAIEDAIDALNRLY